MLITKTSFLTGVTRTRDLDVTPEQIERWAAGELIQNAMPNLSGDDREFIQTGAPPEEWDAAWGEGDDDGCQ